MEPWWDRWFAICREAMPAEAIDLGDAVIGDPRRAADGVVQVWWIGIGWPMHWRGRRACRSRP